MSPKETKLDSCFKSFEFMKENFPDWKFVDLNKQLDKNVIKEMPKRRQIVRIRLDQWVSFLLHGQNPYQRPSLDLSLVQKIRVILRKGTFFYVEKSREHYYVKDGLLQTAKTRINAQRLQEARTYC